MQRRGRPHQEGPRCPQAQDWLGRLSQENDQENRDHPAHQVHLSLLWQNRNEEIRFLHETAASGAWTYTPSSADPVKSAIRWLTTESEGYKVPHLEHG